MSYHNFFHLEMKKGLINDPNGLCFYQGEYYIFFQWNPTGCIHQNKHWGLVKTRDFIHYTKPIIALSPTDFYDKNGCYSGSAKVKNNKLQLFYTANLKDEHNIRFPSQILVEEKDGYFHKVKQIIKDIPQGYTAHFRDPYYFQHSNRHFLILGGQRAKNLTGCCLIYEEIGDTWQFRGELQTNLRDFGYMWECPNLFSLGHQDILIFCPQGLTSKPYKYRNRHQAGYLLGKFNPDTLEFTHEEFKELDQGFDFYAPQVLFKENRAILIGWVGMPEEENNYPTDAEGWRHSLTMAREVALEDNTLVMKPVAEYENLITTQERIQGTRTLLNPCYVKIDLIDFSGEKIFTLSQGKASLKLELDKENKYVKITRTSPFTPTDCRYMFYKELKEMEIYLDTSLVEIYLNKGQQVATCCFFTENLQSPKMLQLHPSLTGEFYPLQGITGILD